MTRTYSKADVGDLTIHYELADYTPPWRSTPADTVMLYHGYARNMLFWQQWVPLLATRFRVLRMDARGCGQTSAPPPGTLITFEQLAADAVGLMDALGIDKVHWVGESSGGIVGLAVALWHPDRLHTLTLCDTPFKRPTDIAATYTIGESDRAAAFAKYGVGGWCRKTLSYRIDTSRATPELWEWYIAEMDKTPLHVAIEMEKTIGRGDFWPQLGNVKVPTLILAGAQSPIAKEAEMKAMQRQMPAARLVTFPGYGHGINLLAPELCVDEVTNFIESDLAYGKGAP